MEQESNGELIIKSPTGSETGRLNQRLGLLLGIWTWRDGRGESFDSSTGFALPDGSIRSPDVSWVLRSRWQALSAEERSRFAPLCPDFVAELVSPGDPLPAVRRKMAHWMENGALLGWLIDPSRKAVEIYRPGSAAPELLENPARVAGEGPVAGFVLELTELWGVQA